MSTQQPGGRQESSTQCHEGRCALMSCSQVVVQRFLLSSFERGRRILRNCGIPSLLVFSLTKASQHLYWLLLFGKWYVNRTKWGAEVTPLTCRVQGPTNVETRGEQDEQLGLWYEGGWRDGELVTKGERGR